jgi:hypothetical protein
VGVAYGCRAPQRCLTLPRGVLTGHAASPPDLLHTIQQYYESSQEASMEMPAIQYKQASMNSGRAVSNASTIREGR